MACQSITGLRSAADFLVWPTTCVYYFWLLILGGVMIVVAWAIYKAEEKRKGEGDFIEALTVSAIVFTIINSIGTLVTNTAGIPMIQIDILLYFIAFTVAMILIWIFKK